MELGGICLTTNDAPRLAAFYQTVFQQEPVVEGKHYAFGNLAIYDPDDVKNDGSQTIAEKTVWLQCFDADIDALYARLQTEIPDLHIISPPERKPWGAYSFWMADPDGHKIAVAQRSAPPFPG